MLSILSISSLTLSSFSSISLRFGGGAGVSSALQGSLSSSSSSSWAFRCVLTVLASLPSGCDKNFPSLALCLLRAWRDRVSYLYFFLILRLWLPEPFCWRIFFIRRRMMASYCLGLTKMGLLSVKWWVSGMSVWVGCVKRNYHHRVQLLAVSPVVLVLQLHVTPVAEVGRHVPVRRHARLCIGHQIVAVQQSLVQIHR
jgi:hypothetical protein